MTFEKLAQALEEILFFTETYGINTDKVQLDIIMRMYEAKKYETHREWLAQKLQAIPTNQECPAGVTESKAATAPIR